MPFTVRTFENFYWPTLRYGRLKRTNSLQKKCLHIFKKPNHLQGANEFFKNYLLSVPLALFRSPATPRAHSAHGCLYPLENLLNTLHNVWPKWLRKFEQKKKTEQNHFAQPLRPNFFRSLEKPKSQHF